MKWPLSVSNIPIAKICLSIFVLGTLKLGLLLNWGGMSEVPEQSGDGYMEKSPAAVASLTQTAAVYAAEEQADPAPKEPQPPMSEQLDLLRQKEQQLERREQDLVQLEQEIEAKLSTLAEQQEELRKLLDEADVLKDKKLKHLVDVYSNMKPKQAAAVLETLNEKIAVQILSGMRGRTAGEILSYVNAQKAASLSAKLTDFQIP